MKTHALALVVLFGLAGSALADQNKDHNAPASSSVKSQEVAALDAGYQVGTQKNISADAPEHESSTLRERERERKGLPHWWN